MKGRCTVVTRTQVEISDIIANCPSGKVPMFEITSISSGAGVGDEVLGEYAYIKNGKVKSYPWEEVLQGIEAQNLDFIGYQDVLIRS